MAEKRIAQYKQIENDLLQKINLGYYKKRRSYTHRAGAFQYLSCIKGNCQKSH